MISSVGRALTMSTHHWPGCQMAGWLSGLCVTKKWRWHWTYPKTSAWSPCHTESGVWLRCTQMISGKKSHPPASCCLVGKAAAHIRVVSFLHSPGNERQWWLCVFTDMIKTMNTYEHLNMMKKGRRVLLHSAMKALLAKNHGKEKTNKYPVWVQRRKEEVTKKT